MSAWWPLVEKYKWQNGTMNITLLAHLSPRLKWAFLITICPLTVFVVVVVNFSHFQLLLQNHWVNFNQTWHKASLVGWRGFKFVQMKNCSSFEHTWIPFTQGCIFKVRLKLTQWFWRRTFLYIVDVLSLFHNEKERALHLNTLDYPSPKNALC